MDPLFVRTKTETLTADPNAVPSPTGTSPIDDRLANETFVYKLHRMVEDPAWQHLISWNYNGTSFVVADAIDFTRDVLPKYFKHNNYSSFIRQLNMYGFHKVNDSPRSPKPNNEPQLQQIWEFSHPKFLRGHPELLPEIKRKVGTSMSPVPPYNRAPSPSYLDANSEAAGIAETLRSQQTAIMASIQSELMKQVQGLQNSFQSVLRELSDTKNRLEQVQAASLRLVDIVGRQQELLGPNYRTFDPAEFAYLHDDHGPGRRIGNSSPSIYVSAMPEFNVNVTDFSLLTAAPTELVASTRSISADGLTGFPSSTATNAGPSGLMHRHAMQALSHDKPAPGGRMSNRPASTLHASAAVEYEFQATQHRRTHSFNQPAVSQQDSAGSMDSDASAASAPDAAGGIDDLMLDMSAGRHDDMWSSY